MVFTVRQARNSRALTQQETADALGISESTYRRYERNPKLMPVGVLDRFSEVVGVPICEIDLSNGRLNREIHEEGGCPNAL